MSDADADISAAKTGAEPAGPGDRTGQEDEVQRLRAVVADLQARLAAAEAGTGAAGAAGPVTAAPPRPGRMRVRRTFAGLLVALAGFGLVASVVGVWGARTTLNTDRWVAAVAPLPGHPEVNAAMSAYLTDEVFSALQVENRLKTALPPKAAFLAAPVSSAVHDFLRDKVQQFMGTQQFKTLWKEANRFAHAKIVAILEGKSKVVSASGDTVTLNLLPVINNALVTISDQLPTLFGKQIQLPTLTSGQIPPDLRQKVQSALGVSLPADFGQITFYSHGRLTGLQESVVLFKRYLVFLVIGTLLCLGLALLIAPGRRRTILQFGVAVAVGVVVLSAVLRAVGDQLLDRVPAGTYREGASVAMHQIFSSLRDRGDLLLWLGVAIAILAYLVGPGRLPVALRRWIATGARRLAHTTRSLVAGGGLQVQAARHLDVLRITGLVVAAVIALLFTSWTAFFVIVILLAGYELAVTVLARTAHEGHPGTPGGPRGTQGAAA